MDDYLAKPFDRDELHRLLEKWCGRPGREPRRHARGVGMGVRPLAL